MSGPESIGIRELRQHASRYVAMAKAGQRVPVTDRGKLVAYLVPAEEPRSVFELHLATALLIRDDVDVVLTYDTRLREAADSHGLATAAPA